MTFQLDAEEYHRSKSGIPVTEADMLYVISNLVYWYPEIKDRLNDAEQAVFEPVFKKALQIMYEK